MAENHIFNQKENNENNNSDIKKYSSNNENLVLDTRFLSYIKLYIFDILNSELIDYSNNDFQTNNIKSIIKVNNTYCSKVIISGLVVGIYESEKYYRIRIDDSTGSINVTLWKSNQNQDDFKHLLENRSGCSDYDELYFILNNIKAKTNEIFKNNKMIYEPKQGDLVMINANIKSFRGRVELNAISCVRIVSSTEEIFNMTSPAVLNRKIYSLASLSQDDYEKVVRENEIIIAKKNNSKLSEKQIQENNQDNKNKEFLTVVYKALLNLSQNIDQSNRTSFNSTSSCDTYSIFMYIRKTNSTMDQFLTYKQVLAALKELELTGLVYSCEDEYHFLPIAI